MNNQDLIVVKQLPVIEEQLKSVSFEIDKKVEEAKSLVCTEETVKTIKQVRANLNKEFKEFETQRKTIKEQVLAPYMQFEEIFKECISDKYKNADIELKNKIDIIENELRIKKEQEIKEYFEEYKNSKNIDFIAYERAKINVTLTASKKSLKEQVEAFVNKVADDLNLIELQEHKAEILVEYKKNLNVSRAITIVLNRIEAVKKEQQKQEQKVTHIEMNANHEIVQKEKKSVDEVFNKQQEKTYTIPFYATGTAPQLKKLEEFMVKEGIKYESITSK